MSFTVPAPAEIEAMTTAQLVATHNEMAFAAGVKPVTKFETRAIGVKRVTRVYDAIRARLGGAKTAPTVAPVVTEPTVQEPAVTVEKVVRDAVKAAPLYPVHDYPAVEKPATQADDDAVDVPAKAPKAKAAKAAAEPKPAKVTFASRCRELILQGYDNAAVWAVLAPEFGYDPKTAVQRTHPGWHRGDMKRKGAL